MNNKFSSTLFFALAALVLASLACQGVGGGGPSASTEEAPSEPIAEIPTFSIESDTTEEESSSTGGTYDGDWTGTNTVDGKDILFVVENNEVVSFNLNYTGESGGCTYHGAVSAGSRTSSSVDSAVIDNDEFSLTYISISDELTFTGTFTSDSEANGTLHIKSSADGLCGEYEKEITWTASKGSSAAVEPTEDTSGFASDSDSIALLTQFFDAVNAGDVDSAVGMVDENVMFGFGSQPNQFGSGPLKSYLESKAGVTYKISNSESLGGAIIDFEAEGSDGAVYSHCQAFVTDGKITMLSLQP